MNDLDRVMSAIYLQLPQPVATDLRRIVYAEIDRLQAEVERVKNANEISFKLLAMAVKERADLRAALEKLSREASGVLSEYNSHGDICATNRGVLLDRIRLAKDVLRSSGDREYPS